MGKEREMQKITEDVGREQQVVVKAHKRAHAQCSYRWNKSISI